MNGAATVRAYRGIVTCFRCPQTFPAQQGYTRLRSFRALRRRLSIRRSCPLEHRRSDGHNALFCISPLLRPVADTAASVGNYRSIAASRCAPCIPACRTGISVPSLSALPCPHFASAHRACSVRPGLLSCNTHNTAPYSIWLQTHRRRFDIFFSILFTRFRYE